MLLFSPTVVGFHFSSVASLLLFSLGLLCSRLDDELTNEAAKAKSKSVIDVVIHSFLTTISRPLALLVTNKLRAP